MAARKVTRCICHDRTFEEIKEYAGNQQITSLKELRDRNYCSNGCRLCGPYIEKMLETGQVSFEYGEPSRSN